MVTVFTAAAIREAVEGLAERIARDYAGKPLLLLGVLKGALYATVDLARALSRVPGGPRDLEVDFLAVSSYGNADRSSGEVGLLKDTSDSIAGKTVLLIEDIVDGGLTLQYLQSLLNGRGPANLRTCVLFDKPYARRAGVSIEYIGLQAPDAFVVGYGLDYQERYRNLPYLARVPAAVGK